MITEYISRFTLVDLVAIEGINEKESEIGIEIEMITAVIKLIGRFPVVLPLFGKTDIEICSAGIAALTVIDRTKSCDQTTRHCTFRYLSRSIPPAIECRCRDT